MVVVNNKKCVCILRKLSSFCSYRPLHGGECQATCVFETLDEKRTVRVGVFSTVQYRVHGVVVYTSNKPPLFCS
jgi:hypothetical protein